MKSTLIDNAIAYFLNENAKTGAFGIIAKTGRSGTTFAHKDIAFAFASWISVAFKL